MSHYLAELYSPKPAWLNLDAEARRQFFDGIGAGMGPLMELGIEPLALGKVDAEMLHAPTQQFFAIWRAPDAVAMRALVDGIAASGWHDYFDTVNATGVEHDLNAHLAQLAAV